MTDRNNPDRCCTADCCVGRGVSKEPPAVVQVAVGTERDYEMVRYVPESELERAHDQQDATIAESFELSCDVTGLREEVEWLRAENSQLRAQIAGVGVRRDVP